MGVLANFKIRTKVLVALLPLCIMVIAAAFYSSIEMKSIDTSYSSLLANEITFLQRLSSARAMNNRFEQYLYKELAETDLDRIRVIDGDLNRVAEEFRGGSFQARTNPEHARAIDSINTLFERQFADSYPIRAAAMERDH